MSAKLVYFNKKVDAIDYLKKDDNQINQHLFQIDRDNAKKGTKQFIIGNFDEIWNLIKSGKNSIYESWEDKPIHFGLDIDYPSNRITYNDLVIHIKQIITGIIMVVNCLDYNIKIELKKQLILHVKNISVIMKFISINFN